MQQAKLNLNLAQQIVEFYNTIYYNIFIEQQDLILQDFYDIFGLEINCYGFKENKAEGDSNN